MATLQNMSGAKFDTAYMQHMVQGHQQAVQRFKSEKGQAQSQPVEAVVGATSPIIEQHLALAQAVLSEYPTSRRPGRSVRLNRRIRIVLSCWRDLASRSCTGIGGLPDSNAIASRNQLPTAPNTMAKTRCCAARTERHEVTRHGRRVWCL